MLIFSGFLLGNVSAASPTVTVQGGNALDIGNMTSNLSSAQWWELHWYYPVLIVGFLIVAFAGYSRHWALFLLGVGIELFCYLYMMTAGTMMDVFTGLNL